MAYPEEFTRLPGWELVEEGLADLAAGKITPSLCAIWIAAPRLRKAGVFQAGQSPPIADPEITLYRLLGRQGGGDAYSKYNAMLRRLRRLEHALDRELFARRRTLG